jgi:hypothetical protein
MIPLDAIGLTIHALTIGEHHREQVKNPNSLNGPF